MAHAEKLQLGPSIMTFVPTLPERDKCPFSVCFCGAPAWYLIMKDTLRTLKYDADKWKETIACRFGHRGGEHAA